MAGGCCCSTPGAVKTRSRACGGWTWPTVRGTAGEDVSGFSPIRRRRGALVLVMCPRPSASGGSGHARPRPGSWPTRPARTAGRSCSRWMGGCGCCASATTRASRPGTRLPVLLSPYGGPAMQRVVRARRGVLRGPMVRRARLRRPGHRRARHTRPRAAMVEDRVRRYPLRAAG